MAIIGGYRVSGLCVTGVPGGLLGLIARSPMIPLTFTLPVAGPVSADLDFEPQSCQNENDNIQLVVIVVDQLGDVVSVRNASSKKIKLLAPDGTTIERPASFLTSGVDGALAYTTKTTDLRQRGTYQIQAEYVIGGKLQSTRWGTFRVGPNVDD